MNQILLAVLSGIAFMGGMLIIVLLIDTAKRLRGKAGGEEAEAKRYRDRLLDCWLTANNNGGHQVAAQRRLAAAMEDIAAEFIKSKTANTEVVKLYAATCDQSNASCDRQNAELKRIADALEKFQVCDRHAP